LSDLIREQIQVFKSKQALHVASLISAQGLVHSRMVLKEVDWFYHFLGIDDFYFLTTKAEGLNKLRNPMFHYPNV
jgi:NAD-specific glutamate dehydrogenase